LEWRSSRISAHVHRYVSGPASKAGLFISEALHVGLRIRHAIIVRIAAIRADNVDRPVWPTVAQMIQLVGIAPQERVMGFQAGADGLADSAAAQDYREKQQE